MKLPQRFPAMREQTGSFMSAPKNGSHKMKVSPSSAAPAPSQARCVVFQPDRELQPGATQRDQTVRLRRGFFSSTLFGNFSCLLNEIVQTSEVG